MKTWFGLLLTVGTLMVGCASGDYARQTGLRGKPSHLSGDGDVASKSGDRLRAGQIGYGVKNPAADRMVGDDLPENREK